LLPIEVHIVKSVSTRKLKCPSSARLGLEPFQLGLAQLGKFQIKLITKVRGYRIVKKGLSRRLTDIEHERRRAKSEVPYISTSGVSASYLTTGHEYWAPMDPIYYHEKSCCFRNTYTRCPIFKRRIEIGWTEPRVEETIGFVDVRRRMFKNPSDKKSE